MEQSFETVVKNYLDERAKTDKQFAKVYAKPNKNLQECYAYIMGEAFKRATSVSTDGFNGAAAAMTDEIAFGLAVHYFDEDSISVGKSPKCVVQTTAPQAKQVKQAIGKKSETENEVGLFG